MHSSRMCTARSLPYGGVSLTETPLNRDPLDRDRPLPVDRQTPWKHYLRKLCLRAVISTLKGYTSTYYEPRLDTWTLIFLHPELDSMHAAGVLEHPARSSGSSVCFWALQSILNDFYNGGLWKIYLEAYINDQYICLKKYWTIIFYIRDSWPTFEFVLYT